MSAVYHCHISKSWQILIPDCSIVANSISTKLWAKYPALNECLNSLGSIDQARKAITHLNASLTLHSSDQSITTLLELKIGTTHYLSQELVEHIDGLPLETKYQQPEIHNWNFQDNWKLSWKFTHTTFQIQVDLIIWINYLLLKSTYSYTNHNPETI